MSGPTTPEQARKAAENALSEVQSLLRHLDSVAFASEAVFSSMTGIRDDSQRRLVGHADALGELSAGLIKRAIEQAERMEINLGLEGHLGRQQAREAAR